MPDATVDLGAKFSSAPLTEQIRALVRLLRTYSEADARPSLWGALRAFIEDYGYSRLSVFEDSTSRAGVEVEVLFSDATSQILGNYRRSGMAALFERAHRSGEPFTRHARQNDGSIFALYPAWNLFLPLQELDAVKGVAVLGGELPDTSDTAVSFIQVATEAAFDRALQLVGREGAISPGALSEREATILSWAAAGKTDAEIGSLLKISARTVRFHTDNAKRKLGVATRIQAITEALRAGLIKV